MHLPGFNQVTMRSFIRLYLPPPSMEEAKEEQEGEQAHEVRDQEAFKQHGVQVQIALYIQGLR